jgi:hypothetical protein
MTKATRPATARWVEGSNARIAHAVLLALLDQAALVIPLVAIAPLLLGDVSPFDATPPAFVLLGIIVALQAGLVIGLGLLRWGRVSLLDLGWRTDALVADVGRGVVGFAMVTAVTMGMQYLVGGAGAVQQAGNAIARYSPAQRMLFSLVGVIAAFGEESIFRGYLQPTMMKRLGAPAGVVLTAAFFSAYHLAFAPFRLIGLFLIGLVYGILRSRDRSLVAPAVAHGLCWAVLGAL